MNAAQYIAATRGDLAGRRENALRTREGMSGGCEGCGACCGRVLPMSGRERATLVEYVRRHGVRPVATPEQMCALLDPATRRCMAYAARSFVCRAWSSPLQAEVVGTRPGQPCGLRADMAGTFLRLGMREMGSTDTWELFGVSLEEVG